jgi:hypothetical protein
VLGLLIVLAVGATPILFLRGRVSRSVAARSIRRRYNSWPRAPGTLLRVNDRLGSKRELPSSGLMSSDVSDRLAAIMSRKQQAVLPPAATIEPPPSSEPSDPAVLLAKAYATACAQPGA